MSHSRGVPSLTGLHPRHSLSKLSPKREQEGVYSITLLKQKLPWKWSQGLQALTSTLPTDMCIQHKLLSPVAGARPDVRKVESRYWYVAHTGITQEHNCSVNDYLCEASKSFGGKTWTILWHILMHVNSILFWNQNETTPLQQNHMAKDKTSCKHTSRETLLPDAT